MSFFRRLRHPRSTAAASERRNVETHVPAEPPTLQLDGLNGLFQSNMGFNGLGAFTLDPVSSSPLQNGASTNSPADSARIATPTQNTPTRPNFAQSRRFHSQPVLDTDAEHSASPITSSLDTPTSDHHDSHWSSAVGRAGTGKSGRVIERLMAENDRLRREKNVLEMKWEEEVKRSDSAKHAMDGLNAKLDSLTTIMDIDKTLLNKRERKLEEIKVELETERHRRERAENETRETRDERDEVVEGLKKDLYAATEQSKRATTQYDVLQRSFKTLDESYSRQTHKLRTKVHDLQEDIVADHKSLSSIQTLMEHHRSETLRSQEAKEQMKQTFEAYKEEVERNVAGIREAAQKNAEAHEQKQQEMQELVDSMRYVINVKQNIRGLE
ncbi:MAG: hypothetical protein Q9183_004479 [Haloplaca sp. 2 TL-2023]